MSEDNRLSVSLGEERESKRKLDDFSSLYGLEAGAGGPAAPRTLSDNQGTYGRFILGNSITKTQFRPSIWFY